MASSVVLMFSGGIDSMSTAVSLSENYESVHLVSYQNGYGHYHIERTRKRAQELERTLHKPFPHRITSIQPLFEDLCIKSLEADYAAYHAAFIWCLGCKLSMHAYTILYARAHDIAVATDGSSRDTEDMVEQAPPVLERIRALYHSYGIRFSAPLYDATREEKRALLRAHKIGLGVQVLTRHLGIQPKCIPGELYYMPKLFANTDVPHDHIQIMQYLDDKIPLVQQFIKEHIHDKRW